MRITQYLPLPPGALEALDKAEKELTEATANFKSLPNERNRDRLDFAADEYAEAHDAVMDGSYEDDAE